MAESKRQGDLGGVLLLQAEKKRLDAEKTVLAPRDARDSFRPAAGAYCQAMVTLLGQYSKALDGLIRKAVKADRIEEAKALKAEKDNVDLMLADMQAKLSVKADANLDAKVSSGKRAEAGKTTLTLPPRKMRSAIDARGSLCIYAESDTAALAKLHQKVYAAARTSTSSWTA